VRSEYVTVVGAGLAGAEAAYQIACRGVPVRLYEMKPVKRTPAHSSDKFGELVCSNSLRSLQKSNAVGMLKDEMRILGSLIMDAADASAVPAGAALAVNRELFSSYITDKIRSHPLITVVTEEVERIPDEGICVIASGPLTADKLAADIAGFFGSNGLYFFDAAAPIVDASSLDYGVVFAQSRYDKGDADYLNCPMDKAQYDAFYEALISAEEAPLHDFDKAEQKDLTVFEGCMPVEVMAKRGVDTLRFGPMKPVGLTDPRTGKEPYACVQLRAENKEKTMFNLVGFQTHLKIGEQKRVFGMIPGLENAEFLRYGVMHRNTYIASPGAILPTYGTVKRPELFFAGQMTGVEGYVESAASGLLAGINAARLATEKDTLIFPESTVIGAMAAYVSRGGTGKFQPMNANFGIVEPLGFKVKGGKSARNEALYDKGIAALKDFAEANL
jgi:methylenetetrahydrofolate--tRNA-(uracil-5-)-methyltransferase